MKKSSIVAEWFLIGGVALVLASILIFLYLRSQAHNTSNYFENVALVRQLKQLDAVWELDVMKSRMGIDPNYDALVGPLGDLNALQDRLQKNVAGQNVPALASAQQALRTAIQNKILLIERFKSHNSVLRNSLFFLPTAADDLRQIHSRDNKGLVEGMKLSAATDAVLLNALIYSQAPSGEAASQIQAQLTELSALGAQQPPALRPGIEIFVSHVRAVLREQPQVNSLLRRIAAVPTTPRIDNIDRILAAEQRKVEQQARQDRQYLLLFAAALMGLFLYAAVRLLRSHAVIQRVNRELFDANNSLELRVAERTGQLTDANIALAETETAIRTLLDNAEQGFMTITQDLVVGTQSSAACRAILGKEPAGTPVVQLLCREMAREADTMQETLTSIFRDSNEYVRELKLGLLPTLFTLDGKTIKAGYKLIAGGRQLMLILTDITETTRLSGEVERERQRLEMIVLAVTEADSFTALVDDYRAFLADRLPALQQTITRPGSVDELYRNFHTYKGLLAQFSFQSSPRTLHQFETVLSDANDWTVEAAEKAFPPTSLLANLESDLQGISEVLGTDFLNSASRLSLSQAQLRAMKATAAEALAQHAFAFNTPVRELLRTLAAVGGLDVKGALALHGRGASALARRLEKQLGPIQIQGDAVSLPPSIYGPFLRSLVHVFRNAADHGIESPQARQTAGKPDEGTISCGVASSEDTLQITIADDGHGVDRAALEAKLVAAGVSPSQARKMPLADMLFRNRLSSRDDADETSGRGIGLAAVKTELDRLGGSLTVETGRNIGTRFDFRLPLAPRLTNHESLKRKIA